MVHPGRSWAHRTASSTSSPSSTALGREAVGCGEFRVLGAGDRGLGVAVAVEEVLPLADHAEVCPLFRMATFMLSPKSRMVASSWRFIWKPPVPGHDPHVIVRVGESDAHRRREREAHRTETAAGYEAVRLGELEELRGPHLVLADIADDSGRRHP